MMKKSLVLLLTTCALSATAQQLSKYEYWFDHDTARRLKVATTDGDISLMVNTGQLATGVHSFNFRAQDSEGRWSTPVTSYFMRSQIGQAKWSYEWWFDSDHENCVKGESSGNVLELSLRAQALKPGIHSFNFRAQDEAGRWSIPVTSYFMRLPNSKDPQATYAYEYWMDEAVDQKVSGTSADGLIMFQVDACNLTVGLHRFAFRVCDDNGNWASPIYQYFVKPYANVHNLVSGYNYWYNGHVEDVQLVRLSQPASPLLLEVDLPTNNLEQEVTRENITMLSTDDGQQLLAIKNVLNMQFVDQRGKWSEVIVDTFATAVGDRVVSLTSFIENPEANEQWNGWTTQGNRSLATDEHWSGKNNNHFRLGNGKDSEMRQTISGLPAGTYMLFAYGKTSAAGQLTMSVAGYMTEFPAVGDENGWSLRTITFVTNGEPFDIVVSATGLPQGQWACIDGFELSVNGIVDKAGTLSLSDVQIASIANLSTWNSLGSAVRLQLEGQYNNKKERQATIYYSIDNGAPKRLADAVVPGTQFCQEVECFFRENASPHIISFYGKDTEGMMSERKIIEIGNIVHGCTVENLPQQVIYTGEAIEIDNLALRDNRTGKLLIEGEDYTILYNNNEDDGQATIIVEGVYPRYMGSRELHFTIKSYIAAEELAVLHLLYEQTEGDRLWTRKWDVQKEQVQSNELTGVSVRNRHVTAIQLRGNRLTGQLPDALFTLPALQTLNLEDNALSGTVNTSAIKPTLSELLLAHNCLSSLDGVIPATVKKLTLGGQTINEVSALHLSQSALQMSSLPNIGLYDHQQQNFSRQADIRLMTDGFNGTPLVILSLRNDEWQLRNDEWCSCVYRQAQGDTIYCSDDVGNHYRLALTFEPGDANVDGQVDVLDLQTDILYIMEKYLTRPYNFTAANLWKDEQINIQDIICFVNLLMNMQKDGSENVSGTRRNAPITNYNGDAIVYVENGKLMVRTNQPVAAFDIIIDGLNETDLQDDIGLQGFTCAVKKVNNGIRIIGYSLSGTVLPVGDHAITNFTASSASVRYVMLSDSEANAINATYGNSLTGIMEIGNSTTLDSDYYDLQGRRVKVPYSHVRKGLYIQKGRKMFK